MSDTAKTNVVEKANGKNPWISTNLITIPHEYHL